MRYGDLDFKSEPVGNFYGTLDLPEVTTTTSTGAKAFFNKLFN